MATETVRVLMGCVIDGKRRDPGDVVKDVARLDALTMSSGTVPQVEIVSATPEPPVETPIQDPLAEQEADADEPQNARPKGRSAARAR